MTIRILLSILLLSFIASEKAQSQDTLGMSQSVVWAHDTATFNQTINVSVTVVNTGTNFYADSLIVYAMITSNTPDDTVAVITHIPPGGLFAGDTSTVPMNWLVDPLKYTGGGNNITVIWPMNPNNDNFVSDSLVLNTFIDTTLGISMWLPTEFKVYPNPSSGVIQLEFTENTDIENVRIYTLNGRLVEQHSAKNKYDLSNLPSGGYMIKLSDKLGRISRGKLIIKE